MPPSPQLPMRVRAQPPYDVVVCLSHLRWKFVFQRPQHIMSRFGMSVPVVFFEEPVHTDGEAALEFRQAELNSNIWIATPHVPALEVANSHADMLSGFLAECLARLGKTRPLLWVYSPLMLPLADGLKTVCTVYDCMDELSGFKNASEHLAASENDLFDAADIVFTGGAALYAAKQDRHPDVHLFPSSVDVAHFAQAKQVNQDPEDQAAIPHPRLGYCGVIDERMDLALLERLADEDPARSIVMVGPVVKISQDELPLRANLHYLGAKPYETLPHYFAGWDAALLPFALNDATRFISPTKTPEYLAAGLPVISTAIADVIRGYGSLPTVAIADDHDAFVSACRDIVSRRDSVSFEATDALLDGMSWDATFRAMTGLIDKAIGRLSSSPSSPPVSVARLGKSYDVLVVGAGFAGAVMAERFASQDNLKVLVIDKRPHVAGNAYDHHDEAGVLVHAYGPHIFHTNAPDILAYLSQFTNWRPYEHRVLASVRDQLLPVPINRTTLNGLYALNLETEEDAAAFLRDRAIVRHPLRTAEDSVLAAVGQDLYEVFFKGYTRKQWGLDPTELDHSVTARIPTRTNLDDRYFTDRFQVIPADGYTKMFERMLDHPNIDVRLGCAFDEIRQAQPKPARTIFTGPIDEYFGQCYGPLPYRSLRFEHQTLDCEQAQPVATINFPDEAVPYTRVTEFKQITGQLHEKTSVVYEYPTAEGDPYYPIPRPENAALLKRYQQLAQSEASTTFVGRLATYRYYNMDQVVAQALATHRRLTQQRAEVAAIAAAE